MKLNFDRETYFTGRNGQFKCTGIELWDDYDNLLISPITSKGKTGRCDIVIPKEHIVDLIVKLQSVK